MKKLSLVLLVITALGSSAYTDCGKHKLPKKIRRLVVRLFPELSKEDLTATTGLNGDKGAQIKKDMHAICYGYFDKEEEFTEQHGPQPRQ